MIELARALLRTGFALKANQLKKAAGDYAHDRAAQGKGIVASYALAAGLFGAAGVFLLAACLVGLVALFRWLELTYGQFPAFGGIAGLLLALTAICAAIAASKLRAPARRVPGLTARLASAIKTNPVKVGQADTARDTAAAILRAPATPVGRQRRQQPGRNDRDRLQDSRRMQAGLLLAATLLGWAATRNRARPRKDFT